VSEIAELELGYRRWLRWYPASFRREYEAEMLGVLLAHARAGQRRPQPMECLGLVGSALRVRLRPRVPRSDRCAFAAVRLMYLGAVVEFAVVLTIVATRGDVKARILVRDPGYTRVEWHAEVTRAFEPLVIAAGLAVGFWLWMAWANGRGYRWARVLFALFFCVNTYSLLHGLAGGSALYARADLAAGTVLWLVEVAAVALVFGNSVGRDRHPSIKHHVEEASGDLLIVAATTAVDVEEEP
jgi:ABC-type multidrug transport system fused ATPase/permease subunit